MVDLSERAHRAASGGSVRMWSSGGLKTKTGAAAAAGPTLSPPATPLRSPFDSTLGSSGLMGSSSSSSSILSSSARAELDEAAGAGAPWATAAEAASVREHQAGVVTTPPRTAAAATPPPVSQSNLHRTPPRTAPSSVVVSRPQSLLNTASSSNSGRSGKVRPSVAQIMTITHPDEPGLPQPSALCTATAVVCGMPIRAAAVAHPAAERRQRPSCGGCAAARRSAARSPALAAVPEPRSSSSNNAMAVARGQAPVIHTTVSPAARMVLGDAPLERKSYDVIITGPKAGSKPTSSRDYMYTEHGVGLDYVPPKYGTGEWTDMAELQGKSKREAEFARRQRERGRDERLDRFEQERQGYVAELESENAARVEAARHRQVKLCKQWDRNVFQKINDQVMRKVDDLDQRSLEKRLRSQSDEFVQQVNRNDGYVFLEPTSHRERHRIDAAQRSNVRYSSDGLVDPMKDAQNRLLAELAEEAELERLSRGMSTSGRWSLEHALGVAGVDAPGMDRLVRAVEGPTKVVDWGLAYELGSKVGGGQFGGRREQLPRWNRGSTALHEMSTDPAAAAMQERLRRAQGNVRLAYDARAKDGGASVGRWKPGDYSGVAMERLGNEVKGPSPGRPFGRQQQNTDPIMPNHYNVEALASAATHRREHIAVNGKGRKLGPFGPTGGAPPAGGGGAGPPNILL